MHKPRYNGRRQKCLITRWHDDEAEGTDGRGPSNQVTERGDLQNQSVWAGIRKRAVGGNTGALQASYKQPSPGEERVGNTGSRVLDRSHELTVSSGVSGASTSREDWRAPVVPE